MEEESEPYDPSEAYDPSDGVSEKPVLPPPQAESVDVPAGEVSVSFISRIGCRMSHIIETNNCSLLNALIAGDVRA